MNPSSGRASWFCVSAGPFFCINHQLPFFRIIALIEQCSLQCKVFTKPLRLHFSAVKGTGVISGGRRTSRGSCLYCGLLSRDLLCNLVVREPWLRGEGETVHGIPAGDASCAGCCESHG